MRDVAAHGLQHRFRQPAYLSVVAWIGGAWAWTIVSQCLLITLANQLLSLEMVFATSLGLLFYYRLLSVPEAIGITLIVVGMVKTFGAFHGNPC